jgi:hypothetical protein
MIIDKTMRGIKKRKEDERKKHGQSEHKVLDEPRLK